MEHATNGLRICEWCGCKTNAKYRACCDSGRLADDFNFEHDLRKSLQAQNVKLKEALELIVGLLEHPACHVEQRDLDKAHKALKGDSDG